METEDLRAYHKHLTDTYDKRSTTHDSSKWHRKTSLKLVEGMPPNAGDYILDIGTGTGTIAFHAASLVGRNGKVVGVDLSKGMLALAIGKLEDSDFSNLEFILGDMERLNLPSNSFDKIYCASAFFCALDPLSMLQHWRGLLKSGGSVGFHALPETSYFSVSVARNVLAKYGFPYLLNTSTGTIDKTRRLLSEAGFSHIDIRTHETGRYIPLEETKRAWIQKNDFVPGQYPHPVDAVPPDILIKCQREFEEQVEALNTEKGVWSDITTYYIYAYK
jgi:ubiquinone/menaquinone biosynthesis C-methylase UbiE